MEWIKVSDELPEFHKQILFNVRGADGIRVGALYRNSHQFISTGDKFFKSDVTHWMSMPERPQK